jgi:hypothetical protein
MNAASRLLPGDLVEVLPAEDIYATLDPKGCYERLPFMPEMLPYCGRRFRVFQRPERTCLEIGGIAQLEHTVMLEDLRCDGQGHDGCDRGCSLLWKEAWLRKVEGERSEPSGSPVPPASMLSKPFPYPGKLEGRYFCQVTEQTNCTRPLGKIDYNQIVRDWRAKNLPPPRFLYYIGIAIFVRVRKFLTGKPHVGLQGSLKKTPSVDLNLKPGDLVQVKSAAEIEATLDTLNRNRGLIFTAEMRPFCGGMYRVLRRVNRIIDPFGKMIDMNSAVILMGSTCDGRTVRWGGCSRFHFHYWREIWLNRVGEANRDLQDVAADYRP